MNYFPKTFFSKVKIKYYLYISFLVLSVLTSCTKPKSFYVNQDWQTEKIYPIQDLEYTVFLIGDAGKPNLDGPDAVLDLLKKQIHIAGKNSATIFLGDNIYNAGLPDTTAKDYPLAKTRINKQLEILKDYTGKVYFIGGNHDWNQGKRDGWARMLRQEAYIENYLQRGNIFLPDNGAAGPSELVLYDKLALLAIDTQWRIHPHDKAEPYAENEIAFRLEEALLRHKYRQILVIGHHPLYSVGTHGGHIPFKHHIFPLTAFKKNLYLPLPIFGSIYAFYRSCIGNIQDIPNRKYQRFRREMLQAFEPVDRLIYACGHDHCLQYFNHQRQHYIVSGSGSKSDHVARKGAEFASKEKGFFRIDFYAGNRIQLEAWNPENGLIYRTRIR